MIPDDNPLVHVRFDIPFDRIRAEHVGPAATQLIADAEAAIAAIKSHTGARTYENTVEAIDRATEPLAFAMTVVGHLESVSTSESLQQAYNSAQPHVAAFYSRIPLDSELYAALRAFAESPAADALDATRARHLRKLLIDFRRHGAELSPADKERLVAIDVELSELCTQFAQNVLKSTNAFELVIADEPRLAGLPPSARDAARESANKAGCEGWRFTLAAPSYAAVMTYLDDAKTREHLWLAYNQRATAAPSDNRELIDRIVAARQRKAQLLGYASFADLVLEDRMAKSGAAATAFLDELRGKCEAAFAAENAELEAFVREQQPGALPLRPSDIAYWAEKQRRDRYAFDEEELRPYFSAESALRGAFTVAERLYGVRIEPAPTMPTWHPSVNAFDLIDESGVRLAAFYVDLYPRPSKRDGAWMNALITGGPGEPHLGLMCGNLTPPVGTAPARLTHREVETIFHEFGHLLHHCLTEVDVKPLAGTNVAWDFVELPSQIMENWCWERDGLDAFARHEDTGEVIESRLFEAMNRARTFRSGNAMMRQLGFSVVDLGLHGSDRPDLSATEFARKVLADFVPTALPPDYAMFASFTHLFAYPVGYAAAYYSYKWAEVLDADAFTRFRTAGIFDRQVGAAFRAEILARGDSADPMDLYQRFMGRPPRVEALLERCGLAPAAQR